MLAMDPNDRSRTSADSPPAPRREASIVVPEGHAIATCRVAPVPQIERTAGGVTLASLGRGSDELESDLDALLEDVEAVMRDAPRRTLLANVAGPVSSLFAPANPEVVPVPGLLVWVLDAAALAGASRGPALVQRLLRRLHRIRASEAAPLQVVFAQGSASASTARARAVVELIAGLGIEVRALNPGDDVVLVEVRRPEGVVLACLGGKPHERTGPVDPYARTVNEAKDRAEREGDRGLLERIEAQEREELAKRLAPVGSEPPVAAVDRAPRLHRLLLAVHEGGGEAAQRALDEELRARKIPLLVLVDPETREAALREWPSGHLAMPVFPDHASLVTATRELGMAAGSFAAAEMPPRALFDWAARQGWTMAINAYRGPNDPVYVLFGAEAVKALAQGKTPASA
jgi:hypothetical protein